VRSQPSWRFAHAQDPAIAPAAGSTGKAGAKAHYAESLEDLVRQGVLEPGTTLTGKYHAKVYAVTITANGFAESDGVRFDSLSQAARELTGQSAVNGWKFWKLEDGTSVGDLRAGSA
jgi:Restriction Enzyme Adenine Methylase Associated/Protein of unknown function (DUF2924)